MPIRILEFANSSAPLAFRIIKCFRHRQTNATIWIKLSMLLVWVHFLDRTKKCKILILTKPPKLNLNFSKWVVLLLLVCHHASKRTCNISLFFYRPQRLLIMNGFFFFSMNFKSSKIMQYLSRVIKYLGKA